MGGDTLRKTLQIADAVRLNASHGDLDDRLASLQLIRRLADDLGRRIPVLLDLQGPKWRVGMLETPLDLAEGSHGAFYPADRPAPTGLAWAVPLPHPELIQGARPGQKWLLDDGNLEVVVTVVAPERVDAQVIVGGPLKARKGVHPIGLDVAFDPLTPKDLVDIRWGVEHGVDFFAQSFVRQGSDVEALAGHIQAMGGEQPIIAKIEHPQALANLEEILDVCWGVMVARGDLGVELGVDHVPALQKRIIRMARRALKPVITATQMLESMIENPQPTRAEASDVANAIWDGTDAVMLSAESAVGAHPLAAVEWLARIAEDADAHYRPRLGRLEDNMAQRLSSRTDVSVAFAACRTAEEIGAKLIVVFTEGGGSARMVSRLAANIPVVGATTDLTNARRMGLLRGVRALPITRQESTNATMASVEGDLKNLHALEPGDRVVMTFGLPLWLTGNTNTMRVIQYE